MQLSNLTNVTKYISSSQISKIFYMNYLIELRKLQPSSWINTIYIIFKYLICQFTSLKKMLDRTPVCGMEKMGQGVSWLSFNASFA